MPKKDLDIIFDKVFKYIASKIKEFGFKRHGFGLKKICGSNAAIVEFQKSQANNTVNLSFTVNLAVVCGVLLDPEMLTLKKVKSHDGHFRVRIGALTPSNQDLWWEIREGTDAEAMAFEVSELILGKGLPYIEKYFSDNALIELWESGKSPGLTEGQRLKNLKYIKEKTKSIKL